MLPRAEATDTEWTYRGWQAHLRKALGQVVDEADVGPEFQDWIEQRLGEIEFRLTVKDGVLVYVFSVQEVGPGLALGYMVLRNSDYPLRRCGGEDAKGKKYGCGRYFVIFDPHKRNQKYCEECAPEVAREQALARSAESRRKARERNKRGKK